MAKEASLDVDPTYSEARKTYDLSYGRAVVRQTNSLDFMRKKKSYTVKRKGAVCNILKFNIFMDPCIVV